jgi:hypothetical protein
VDRLPADVDRHVGGDECCGTGDLVDMPGTPIGTTLPMPERNPSGLSRINPQLLLLDAGSFY